MRNDTNSLSSKVVDVTVICPCFNEQDYAEKCLRSILSGLRKYRDSVEIIVVDGMSNDGTREIISGLVVEYDPILRMIDNPRRAQVYALNLGVKEARGNYIVRCDMHAEYPDGYIDSLVDILKASDEVVANVGTPHSTRAGADTAIAKAIALAMTSSLAVGAGHRSARIEKPKKVDTLLFGAWRKKTFSDVGGFDERFIRGQDLEHNWRLKKNGYLTVMFPGKDFSFFTRKKINHFCRMLYQYAATKVEICFFAGYAITPRMFIPCLFVFGFVPLSLLMGSKIFLALQLGYWGSIAIHSSIQAVTRRALWPLLLVLVIPLGHVSHAAGTLASLARLLRGRQVTTKFGVTR